MLIWCLESLMIFFNILFFFVLGFWNGFILFDIFFVYIFNLLNLLNLNLCMYFNYDMKKLKIYNIYGSNIKIDWIYLKI